MSILIHNCTAVLMDEAGTVLPNAYVVVEGTKIRSVSTQRPWGSFEEQIDGQGNVLMPGFVNAHSHVPMTAMRGYGDGNNLQDWLHNYIFPVEARWDDRAIRACTDLGLAEMIASGVTTIADMYGHTDAVAQEVAASGISANLCCGGVQFTDTFDPATHHDCVVQRELTEKWHGYNDGQILVDASIHGEYTSHHPLWQWMADYAKEHGLGMHVHISETRTEHAECLARHGKTPIQVLNDYGVWDVRAIAAHCVWTTPEDWSVMASKGVSAIHNPMSNLKLGSGIAPVLLLVGYKRLRRGGEGNRGRPGVYCLHWYLLHLEIWRGPWFTVAVPQLPDFILPTDNVLCRDLREFSIRKIGEDLFLDDTLLGEPGIEFQLGFNILLIESNETLKGHVHISLFFHQELPFPFQRFSLGGKAALELLLAFALPIGVAELNIPGAIVLIFERCHNYFSFLSVSDLVP